MDSAVRVMRSKCNGRSECTVSVDSLAAAAGGQQDPCPGTQRYLEAHYTCDGDSGSLVMIFKTYLMFTSS